MNAQTNPWTWRAEDETGRPVDSAVVPSAGFPTQAEAEAWLSESWADLADAGIAQVTLLEEGQVVYGPMSLAAG